MKILIAFCTILAFTSPTTNVKAEVNGVLKSTDGSVNNYSSFVIFIEEGASLPKKKKKSQKLIMAQVNREFSPSVMGIQKGDEVQFTNFDNVFHNVFSLDPKNKFDLGIFKGKQRYSDDYKTKIKNNKGDTQVFNSPGKQLVFCNIHENMVGTIYIFEHEYFTMSEKSGLFKIPSPPDGEYTVVIDGNKLKEPIKKKYKFSKGMEPIQISFDAVEDKDKIKHRNKEGKQYNGDDWELGDEDFY